MCPLFVDMPRWVVTLQRDYCCFSSACVAGGLDRTVVMRVFTASGHPLRSEFS